MIDYPIWTDQQKFDYLRELAETTAQRVREQGAYINDLHTRLSRVEGKTEGAGT